MKDKVEIENIPQKYQQEREILVDILPLDIPLSISIEPTNICNFKCVMCEQNSQSKTTDMVFSNMTMECFEKLTLDIETWCKRYNKKIKTIRLYANGEPLLHPEIGYMVKRIKDADITHFIEITTNGSLLNNELAEQFVDYGLDYIRFSIYSIYKDKNNKITQSKSNPEEIRENIKYLRNYRDKVGATKPFIQAKLIDTYSKENEEFKAFYKGIADDTFIDQPMDANSGEDIFINLYEDRAEQIRNEVHNKRIYHKRKVCRYPFTHMVILSSGDVCICCNDFCRKTVYGNVMKHSLMDWWTSKSLYKIRVMQLEKKGIDLPVCEICDVPFRDCKEDDIDEFPKDKLNYSKDI